MGLLFFLFEGLFSCPPEWGCTAVARQYAIPPGVRCCFKTIFFCLLEESYHKQLQHPNYVFMCLPEFSESSCVAANAASFSVIKKSVQSVCLL